MDKKSLKKFIKEEIQRIQKKEKLQEEKKIIQSRINLLNETGEWPSYIDLEYTEENPDTENDYTSWIIFLKEKIEELKNLLNNPEDLKLEDIKGFDKYQGPYATVKIKGQPYEIWSSEFVNSLILENLLTGEKKEGTIEGLAEIINDL